MKLDPHTQFFGDYVHAMAEIELLRHFIKHMDNSLSHSVTPEIFEKLPDDIKMIAEDESDLIWRPYAEILNSGFIISVAIFLEKQLIQYCENLAKAEALELTQRDLSGSLAERFRKYCLHIAKLPTLTTDSNWDDIRGLMEIRNCLVHKDGRMIGFGKSKTVEAFINKHKTPAVEDDVLMISGATSFKCLEIVQAFTESIYHTALEKYKVRPRRINTRK